MTYFLPPTIGEHEGAHLWDDGRQDDALPEDCVWCSTLLQCVIAFPELHLTATHAEAEALRQTVTGPLGGSTVEQARQAVKLRYGKDLEVHTGGDADLWNSLAVGKTAAVIGAPSNCLATSPIRKYVPTFLGLHCVLVARTGAEEAVTYWDPMAPNGSQPMRVSKLDLLRFYEGNHFILNDLTTEDPMLLGLNTPAFVFFDAPVGVQLYDEAGRPLFKSTVPIVARESLYTLPIAGQSFRVFAGNDGDTRRLLLIKVADCSNLRDVLGAVALQARQAQYDADAKSLIATATAKLGTARPVA